VDEAERIAGAVVSQADEFIRGADGLRCGFAADLEARRAGDLDGRQAIAAGQHGESGGWGRDAASSLEKSERVGEKHAQVVEQDDTPAVRSQGDPCGGRAVALDGNRGARFSAIEGAAMGEKPAPAIVEEEAVEGVSLGLTGFGGVCEGEKVRAGVGLGFGEPCAAQSAPAEVFDLHGVAEGFSGGAVAGQRAHHAQAGASEKREEYANRGCGKGHGEYLKHRCARIAEDEHRGVDDHNSAGDSRPEHSSAKKVTHGA